MVKIYTKKGDDGTTGLWYGGRVEKSGLRTDAYGTLDEACSALGVARSLCGSDQAELATDILALQNELFVAGAELATAPEAAERLEDGISRITASMRTMAATSPPLRMKSPIEISSGARISRIRSSNPS